MFFHVRDFYKIRPEEPGPIAGEPIEFVCLYSFSKAQGKDHPKAKAVYRKTSPVRMSGEIHSYDHKKGWGFIRADGRTVFFHRSDFGYPWFPVAGTPVSFWVCPVAENPRAILVENLR